MVEKKKPERPAHDRKKYVYEIFSNALPNPPPGLFPTLPKHKSFELADFTNPPPPGFPLPTHLQ